MVNQQTVDHVDFERWRQRRRLPHDSCVYMPNLRTCMFDSTWVDPHDQPPLWYRINHSRDYNCRPCFVADMTFPNKGRLMWLATRDIDAGDELVYNYDNAPREWG